MLLEDKLWREQLSDALNEFWAPSPQRLARKHFLSWLRRRRWKDPSDSQPVRPDQEDALHEAQPTELAKPRQRLAQAKGTGMPSS